MRREFAGDRLSVHAVDHGGVDDLLIGNWIADRKLDFQGDRIREGLLIGNWISGGSGPGGAWWDLDALAVNDSILRGRRVRLRMGTWGGERRLRKRELRARIEPFLAVWGQSSRRRGVWVLTSESLGVKEPAFLELR